MSQNHHVNVLVVGSGGREHALARQIAESPRRGRLWVAPGNAGTASVDGCTNVSLDVADHEAVVSFCKTNLVDLVVIGPEGPLVDGLVDSLRGVGRSDSVACFGPSAAAAQLEGSKSFARAFADRHSIPGPRCHAFTEVEAAYDWLDELGGPVVVKADGLASGKGVIIPETRVETERAIFDLLADRTMGDAGSTVVLEERLHGEELSLFGLTDGKDLVVLGMAQDHKRVGEGDTGPNTGGMGAFSPVPGKEDLEAELARQFLRPVVEGMAAEGTPYVGVIYAGIMLTAEGPKLIEYNCRFGDPEAQVILPLLETDVLDLMVAAANGNLARLSVERKPKTTAATVVVAAQGYPNAPTVDLAIPSVTEPDGVSIIHAGTRLDGDQTVNSGGRVLSVTGVGDDLGSALDQAYRVVDQIIGQAPRLFARSDIGWRYARRGGDAYEQAGVSFDRAEAVMDAITRPVRTTHDSRVVAGVGSFGGVFDVSALKDFDQPLLVASTDGVGTKTVLAEATGRWNGIGVDIVNHGINDVLVQGATPLFFLDTVAAARLEPSVVAEIVTGMAAACRDAGCVLLGGETAEMPDVLTPGSVDVAGTIVGAVDRVDLLPRASIAPGHLLVGLASSGLHTNGYSLARKVVSEVELDEPVPGGEGETFAEALLAPHRSYLPPLRKALAEGLVDGLSHITGGGLIDNLPRSLPDGCGAEVNTGSWTWPAIFTHLAGSAGLTRDEAFQTFNLGIGMVVLVAPDRLAALTEAIAEPTTVIGTVVEGDGVTLI